MFPGGHKDGRLAAKLKVVRIFRVQSEWLAGCHDRQEGENRKEKLHEMDFTSLLDSTANLIDLMVPA